MNQPNDTDRSLHADERLNRLWDGERASDEADADLLNLIHRFHAADEAPDPDGAFLGQLRANLVRSPTPKSATPRHQAALGFAAVSAHPRPFSHPSFVRAAFTALAAALLVAALWGGGQWLPGSGSSLLVASAMASPIATPGSPVPLVTQAPASSEITLDLNDIVATQRMRFSPSSPVLMLHIVTSGAPH